MKLQSKHWILLLAFLPLFTILYVSFFEEVFAQETKSAEGYINRNVEIWGLFFKLMVAAFIVGAVVQVAILIFVGAASWDVERIIEEVPADAESIKVIGQQWFWSFEHADGTKEVNELHVQKDKPYRFEITSLDVNHAFNVPDWTLMIDAVPGRINTLWNMFTEDGEYLIQCREYCGFSHYNMKAKLFVEPAVTPVAAETPPATTPNATVLPNQQQQQQQQPATQEQQQPSANATTSAAAGNATSAATAGGGGVTLTILEGSSIQGSPDYDPDELTVKKGDKITVNNVD